MTSHLSSENASLPMSEHPDIQELDRGSDRTPVVAPFVHGVALLGGSYAAISAWVVGFQDQSPLALTNLIVGAGIVLLSLAVLREHLRVPTGAYALMGVWLIIAPWAVQNVDSHAAVIVSNVVVGAVVAAAGAIALGLGALRIQRR
jgi:hypothetical protein